MILFKLKTSGLDLKNFSAIILKVFLKAHSTQNIFLQKLSPKAEGAHQKKIDTNAGEDVLYFWQLRPNYKTKIIA